MKQYVIFSLEVTPNWKGRYFAAPLLVGGFVNYTRYKEQAWSTSHWSHLVDRLDYLRHTRKLAVGFEVISV